MLVSLHTYFFMASSGATQTPPVSLHPGDPAIVTSMPPFLAFVIIDLNVCFQAGDMNGTGGDTTVGSNNAPEKMWTPPMPIRCIQARSSAAPTSLTLPFIQCHQT